jgi:heme exporter protein A
MTPADDALLEIRGLELWRGDRHILRDLSFTVSPGQLVQVVGPNGVGKTTLLRAVCGLLPAESGEVRWRGRTVRRGVSRDEFHADIAYLAHANALKGDLTGEENLWFSVELRRAAARSDYASMLSTLGIEACGELPGRVLSAGQRRRVALARVLMSQATLWVLDEPTTNLDTAGFALVESCISDHLNRGGGVLVAAHHGLLGGDSRAAAVELAA